MESAPGDVKQSSGVVGMVDGGGMSMLLVVIVDDDDVVAAAALRRISRKGWLVNVAMEVLHPPPGETPSWWDN